MSGFQRCIKACGRGPWKKGPAGKEASRNLHFLTIHIIVSLCERTRVNALLEASVFGSVY